MMNFIASTIARIKGEPKPCKHRRPTKKEAEELGFRKHVNFRWEIDTDRCALCGCSLRKR